MISQVRPQQTTSLDRSNRISGAPKCFCGEQSASRVSQKDNANKGRRFFNCSKGSCKFFEWDTSHGVAELPISLAASRGQNRGKLSQEGPKPKKQRRGLKACPEGSKCPYQHEYQHTLEFSHDNNKKDEDKEQHHSGFVPFVGAGKKLGGASHEPSSVHGHKHKGHLAGSENRPLGGGTFAGGSMGKTLRGESSSFNIDHRDHTSRSLGTALGKHDVRRGEASSAASVPVPGAFSTSSSSSARAASNIVMVPQERRHDTKQSSIGSSSTGISYGTKQLPSSSKDIICLDLSDDDGVIAGGEEYIRPVKRPREEQSSSSAAVASASAVSKDQDMYTVRVQSQQSSKRRTVIEIAEEEDDGADDADDDVEIISPPTKKAGFNHHTNHSYNNSSKNRNSNNDHSSGSGPLSVTHGTSGTMDRNSDGSSNHHHSHHQHHQHHHVDGRGGGGGHMPYSSYNNSVLADDDDFIICEICRAPVLLAELDVHMTKHERAGDDVRHKQDEEYENALLQDAEKEEEKKREERREREEELLKQEEAALQEVLQVSLQIAQRAEMERCLAELIPEPLPPAESRTQGLQPEPSVRIRFRIKFPRSARSGEVSAPVAAAAAAKPPISSSSSSSSLLASSSSSSSSAVPSGPAVAASTGNNKAPMIMNNGNGNEEIKIDRRFRIENSFQDAICFLKAQEWLLGRKWVVKTSVGAPTEYAADERRTFRELDITADTVLLVNVEEEDSE